MYFFVFLYIFVTIFLADICVEVLQALQCFRSGVSHGIYAQLIAQATAFNTFRKIGLLQGAGTCIVTWFYSMHWLL